MDVISPAGLGHKAHTHQSKPGPRAVHEVPLMQFPESPMQCVCVNSSHVDHVLSCRESSLGKTSPVLIALGL